eukprot:scaffold64055_cov42-Phaeocystis_antarctica.AAC.2
MATYSGYVLWPLTLAAYSDRYISPANLTLTPTLTRHEHICPAAAPECRGYVMGSSWGTCAGALGGGGGGGGAGACPNRHRVSPPATAPLQGLLRQLAWPLEK